jgi:hypothetical protein
MQSSIEEVQEEMQQIKVTKIVPTNLQFTD